MPLEYPYPSVNERVAMLNARFGGQGSQDIVAYALSAPEIGRTGMVSSFGAESVVLLHMLAKVDKAAPVIFINTEMLFHETLEYQRTVAKTLGLRNITTITPEREQVFLRDTSNLLHATDPDACCALRKAEPLERALDGFDGWITGRKRFQGGQRADLQFFEADGDSRIKINPLAYWSPQDVRAYIDAHRLPRHPLVTKGFASLGCAPCTTRIVEGEPDRAGRWRGKTKTECGIHFDTLSAET